MPRRELTPEEQAARLERRAARRLRADARLARKNLKRLDRLGEARMGPRERMFIQFYLNEAQHNATKAAAMAGFHSPRNAASDLMRDPVIRATLDWRLSQVSTPGEILTRLSSQAKADMVDISECFKDVTEVIGISKGGEPVAITRRVLDWEKVKAAGLGPLIKKVTPGKHGDTVELYDAQRADELVGKSHKLWVDRQEIDSTAKVTEMTDEELAAFIARGAK